MSDDLTATIWAGDGHSFMTPERAKRDYVQMVAYVARSPATVPAEIKRIVGMGDLIDKAEALGATIDWNFPGIKGERGSYKPSITATFPDHKTRIYFKLVTDI